MRTRWETPYLPEGFRSARTGTRLPIRVKSSIESGTFAEWATARRWRTAFVEPPRAITTAIAFSSDFRVMMSLGWGCRPSRSVAVRPICARADLGRQ